MARKKKNPQVKTLGFFDHECWKSTLLKLAIVLFWSLFFLHLNTRRKIANPLTLVENTVIMVLEYFVSVFRRHPQIEETIAGLLKWIMKNTMEVIHDCNCDINAVRHNVSNATILSQ